MTQTITNELVYEVLKTLQADVAQLKRDNRDLKVTTGMTLGLVGEMVKAAGRSDERFAELEVRIDRIEERLHLQDHPPV